MKRIIHFVLILFFLCSCENKSKYTSNTAGGILTHPTEENILLEDHIDHIIRDHKTKTWVNQDSLILINSIGVMNGDPNYMFGRLASVKVISDSLLIALDQQRNLLRVFNIKSGTFIDNFSRSGRGPAELIQPSDMITNGHNIYISDRLSKIEIFKNIKGEIKHEDQLKLRFSPNNICVFDNHLFVSGTDYNSFKTIHKFNLESFDHLMSFHEAYQSANPAARITLSNNSIVCNKQTGTVVLISPYLPYIYGYDNDGEMKWISQIDDFNPARVTEEVNGTINKSLDTDGPIDLYTGLAEVRNTNYVVVQLVRNNRERSDPNFEGRLTYLVNTESGESIFLSDSLTIIEDVTPDYIVTRESKGYPVLNTFINPLISFIDYD